MLRSRGRTFPTWIRVFMLLPLLLLGPRPAQGAVEKWFVRVQDGRLIYAGDPVRLKGVNFYPKNQPWAYFWQRWDGPATREDLRRLSDFGGNTVRVLLPYRADQGLLEDSGAVKPVILDRLRQLAQIAG